MSLNPGKRLSLKDKLNEEERALKAELEAVGKEKSRASKKEASAKPKKK